MNAEISGRKGEEESPTSGAEDPPCAQHPHTTTRPSTKPPDSVHIARQTPRRSQETRQKTRETQLVNDENDDIMKTMSSILVAAGYASVGGPEQLLTAIRVQTAQLDREAMIKLIFEITLLLANSLDLLIDTGLLPAGEALR